MLSANRDRRKTFAATVVNGVLLAIPTSASAHFFIQSYSLPIPFWMYAWGAAGALLLSFILIAIFTAVPAAGFETRQPNAREENQPLPNPLSAGSLVALALLVACILSGLAGTAHSFDNFNMTFFWIIFVLGVPYLIACIGDFYARMNPWQALVICLERFSGQQFTGRLKQPVRWGHWPAVLLYIGFINLELFGQLLPRGVSLWLLAYSLANVAGAWLFGRQAWFEQGEFFGVMFRLIGMMAPVERSSGALRLRMPFSGLLHHQTKDFGLVVFVLFMLSSTAFDGMHATRPWVNLYWAGVNPHLVGGLGLSPREQNDVAIHLYQIWERLTLAASPFIYLVLLAAVAGAMKVVVRSGEHVQELVMKFALCLVPIAFVYHVTHYFTLLLAQAGQIIRLISDPLGVGWNLFGTGHLTVAPIMIGMGPMWHTQVSLIIAGHIASVWVAHVRALTIFDSPRRAAVSQLPMIALMMVFTTFGLWILSLPLF